jgi:anti-sigma B factor antagonist
VEGSARTGSGDVGTADYRITILQPADDVLVLRVSGRIQLSDGADFEQQLLEAADRGAAYTVVDLSAVDYLDTTGLDALWASAKRCRLKGCELVIACAAGRPRDALANSSLDQVVTTHDTLDEALRHADSWL